MVKDELDDALGKLLDEVRVAGVEDDTEEIINNVGDRLHGWCHPSGHIKSAPATQPAGHQSLVTPTNIAPPVRPSPG